MDNDMKETVINKAYEEIPGLIEKEPAEMEIGGVVSDGENAWMVNDVTVSPTNASADMLSVAKKLCSAVYHGDSFDDEKYNELISYIQTVGS